MKNAILTFLLFTPLFCFTQSSWPLRLFDCQKKESFTDWLPSDSLATCEHEWVYAEWQDVNELRLTSTLLDCPCGCGGSENEARICSKCLLNQNRVRSYWYVKVDRKSEYIKIIDRKNGQ